MNGNKKTSLLHRSVQVSLIIYFAGWGIGIFAGLVLRSQLISQPFIVHPRTSVSPWYYISHNLSLEGILLLSACLPFIGTGLILLGNGVFDGVVAALIAQQYGIGFLLGGLLPHGIPETAAWIVAGAAGIRLSCYLFSKLMQFFSKESQRASQESEEPGIEHRDIFPYGRRETSSLLRGLSLAMLTAALLLVGAGFLEAYVSPYLAFYIGHL